MVSIVMQHYPALPGRTIGAGRIAAVSAIALMLAVNCADPAAAQQKDAPLASPAIDQSLFKDGMIENREQQFGNWFAKCQQIAKIQRRICNLLGKVTDADGSAKGAVLVATDDKGQPAMMISLNTAIRADRPIVIEASYDLVAGKKTRKKTYKKNVVANRCDPDCKAVFPFDSELAYVLNAGVNVEVRATMPAPEPLVKSKKKAAASVTSFTIPAEGFAAALQASTANW